MGNKTNAYELFVKDACRKRRDKGEDVVFTRMFKELDPVWRGMSENSKQWYKDKAKRINSGRTSGSQQNDIPSQVHNPPVPNNPPPPSESNISETAPSTSQTDEKEFKVKHEAACKYETKPLIKQEHGCKRDYEAMNVDNPPGSSQDLQVIDEPGQVTTKKVKLGIPNWKNIKKTNQSESVRYSDYYLLELKNTCESIVKTRVTKLTTMPMYSYSCNVLCKYKDGDKNKFIPLEITICAHSIKCGRTTAPYHVLIDPGSIPVGYYNKSKDHSALHKITVGPGNYPAEARNDYKDIYKEMLSYTKAGERTVLVSDHHDLEQVKCTIEWLYEKAVEENPTVSLAKPSTWTILPMVDYVVSMFNHIHMKMLGNDSPKFVLPYYLRMQLESSLLDYNDALMCPYHSKADNQTKWCTLSCAQRVFFVIEPTLEAIQSNYERALSKPSPAQQRQTQQPFNRPPLEKSDKIVYAPDDTLETITRPLAIEAPPGSNSLDPRLKAREGISASGT